MSRYRKAVASALWLQLALVACYKPLGVVEALFTQSGQPSLIFFVRQIYRDIGFSLSYTHRQSTPVDIAHYARGFYSTPGLVFYVFPTIYF